MKLTREQKNKLDARLESNYLATRANLVDHIILFAVLIMVVYLSLTATNFWILLLTILCGTWGTILSVYTHRVSKRLFAELEELRKEYGDDPPG